MWADRGMSVAPGATTAAASQRVPDRLIRYISRHDLQAGQRLPSIRRLSSILKVSPNAVRDALMQLQTMGLVAIHPRVGATVRSVDYSPLVEAFRRSFGMGLDTEDRNLFSLIDARLVIEMETVAKAAREGTEKAMFPVFQAYRAMEQARGDQDRFVPADEQFHVAIARMAGNKVLTAILEGLLTLLRPYRLSLHRSPEEIDGMQERHLELYERILAGDVERAQAITREASDYQVQQLTRRVVNPAGKKQDSPRDNGVWTGDHD